MTEKLQTLMREQADSVDFAAPDLDAMIRTGERRVRHRRLGALAGVAAVTAAMALLVPGLTPSERAVQPAGPAASDAAPLSWVDGSTLHEGEQRFDLGFRPVAYVRTSVGYVLADRDGRVWSWVAGEAKAVGRTDPAAPRLVADDESDLAGWFEPTEGSYAVLDQQPNGSVVAHQAPPRSGPEDFAALDAGVAYWTGSEGPSLFDLETGRAVRVEDVTPDFDLGDLEDGRLATPDGQGVVVRTTDGQVLRALSDVYSDYGSLSPDGRYYTSDADQPEVYDVGTGEKVTFDLGGREFATGYEWLGPRTLAVLAAARADDGSRAELLQCQVPEGSCEAVAGLGTFEQMADRLLLPVGLPVDG
jgi:hypothetical protein